MDKILIRDLKIFAYHGVNPEEKRDGQEFVIDMDVSLDMSAACISDELDDTVSYAKIIKTVTAAFTQEKYNLLEKAAQVCVDAVFAEYDRINAVRIVLKKPHAPIKADFGFVAAELYRERKTGQ